MNVFHGYAVAGVVVPYGEHTAEDGRVLFVECAVADGCRRPVFVEILAVEIIVIIACGRHDIYQSVGNAYEFVALFLHFHRIGIAVVPAAHDDVVRLDGRISGGMSQCSPAHGLLAVAFNKAYVAVGELAELLHHLLFGVGIFVCAYVHTLASEHGIASAEIFGEQSVKEFVCLRIEEVEVVHAVFLRSYLGFVVGEGERVGGYVYLGNHFYVVVFGKYLHVDELLLGVRTVFCRESGICVGLQSEGRLHLGPVGIELQEAVVVEM